jgi:hypothetical protein
MPDDWDDSKPDWATKPGGGVEVGRPGEEQSLTMENPEQTMWQISYGNFDDKTGNAGETDQDCCDNARSEWIKGQNAWIQNDINEAMDKQINNFHDGKSLDEFFNFIKELNEMNQRITGKYEHDPDEIETDHRETMEELKQSYNNQRKQLESEKTAVINSMECDELKMFVKDAATNRNNELPPIMAQTAVQVYKEWMDCEGTDFGGDDDMFMAGEPMDIAFNLLKSQKIMDTLFKLDWEDDPEGSEPEERANDMRGRKGKDNHWKGPKRDVHSDRPVGDRERRPRGQHGTHGGKSGYPPGLSSRDKARQADKLARDNFREQQAGEKADRLYLEGRDNRTKYHPGSSLLHTDEIDDPHGLDTPPRVTYPVDRNRNNDPSTADEWEAFKQTHPLEWEDIVGGTSNMKDFMSKPNKRQSSLGFEGLEGLDENAHSFVSDWPKDNIDILDEMGMRGHLPGMEHELYIDDDGKAQGGGKLELTPEEGQRMQEHMEELSEAPTVGRRRWIVSTRDDEEAPPDEGYKEEDFNPDIWSPGGEGLQSRPTFFGLPWNEETGFTLGEPIDAAWSSLLKNRFPNNLKR